MGCVLTSLRIFFTATRAYSLPISSMSWLVPFLLGLCAGGNLVYGIFSLFGIIILHLATNIFDDTVDFQREKNLIDSGTKVDFNFQQGKCSCIFNNLLSLRQYYIISFILFSISLLIAVVFVYLCGLKLLYVILPCIFICLLYPILGCLGLGEVLVSVVFSPLIYSGVYYVMTGYYSSNILLLSVSTGLLAVAVLHNHMLLDYRYDTFNRKITLCRILGSEIKSFILLLVIVILSYLNIVAVVFAGKLGIFYLLPLLSIPWAIKLLTVMFSHIKNPSNEDFLYKFKLPQNLLTSFTILLCISIVADKCIS